MKPPRSLLTLIPLSVAMVTTAACQPPGPVVTSGDAAADARGKDGVSTQDAAQADAREDDSASTQDANLADAGGGDGAPTLDAKPASGSRSDATPDVFGDDGVPLEAATEDASEGGASDAALPGSDGGDPYTSPITFTGTISGTVPPGTSYIRVELDYASRTLDPAAPAGHACGSPSDMLGSESVVLAPVTPATYTLTWGTESPDGGANFCTAGFQIVVSPTSDGSPLIDGSPGALAPCGCVDGQCAIPPYGEGAPPILGTTVICNATL